MQVIVNVDDVGLHAAVQRAVEAGAAAGIVTSASVLANGPSVDDARRLRGIGLGAHLNILRGRPLSPPEEVPSLVDERGLFLGSYSRLFLRYVSHRLDLDEVEREWERQIDFLLSMGLSLTHIDSEKHIHCWPRLMSIACRLAGQYGLRWVRRTVERSSQFRWDTGGLRTKLLCAWGRFHRSPPAGAETGLNVSWPDAVWGVADQGRAFQAARFRSYVSRLGDADIVEIVCHPGLTRPGDKAISETFGPLRVQGLWGLEYGSLMQDCWRDVFDEHGLELTHYGQAVSTQPTADATAARYRESHQPAPKSLLAAQKYLPTNGRL